MKLACSSFLLFLLCAPLLWCHAQVFGALDEVHTDRFPRSSSSSSSSSSSFSSSSETILSSSSLSTASSSSFGSLYLFGGRNELIPVSSTFRIYNVEFQAQLVHHNADANNDDTDCTSHSLCTQLKVSLIHTIDDASSQYQLQKQERDREWATRRQELDNVNKQITLVQERIASTSSSSAGDNTDKLARELVELLGVRGQHERRIKELSGGFNYTYTERQQRRWVVLHPNKITHTLSMLVASAATSLSASSSPNSYQLANQLSNLRLSIACVVWFPPAELDTVVFTESVNVTKQGVGDAMSIHPRSISMSRSKGEIYN